MIWTLRIECVSGRYFEEQWIRVVEIDSAAALYALHRLIQNLIDFDRDHAYEFYASRNYRSEGVGLDVDELLEQVFPLPKNHKLYYHFDFGDDWRFEIRRLRNKPKEPTPRVKYPRVIESTGRNPRQYGYSD